MTITRRAFGAALAAGAAIVIFAPGPNDAPKTGTQPGVRVGVGSIGGTF